MIRIAIIGTGSMAGSHAANFKGIRGCKVVACCDIDSARAKKFAKQHGIPATGVFDDVDKMLREAKCDAVSIVTTDASHASLSLKAIAAGKHVLCEKPLATNYADAKKMASAAKRKGVINMVNLSYRNSSAIQKAHQLVQAGLIGKVMHFEASYLQSWLSSKIWGDWKTTDRFLWRLSTKHHSKGVLGDVGVHILDFATFPAGDVKSVNCLLKAFPKAKSNRIGKYKLDANDSAVITVELAGGGIGTIHTTRWATGHMNSLQLRLHGDKGAIFIDLDESREALKICKGADVDKCKWKVIKCGKTPSIYSRFVKSIKTGRNDQPDFARGAAIQKIMDACFVSDEKRRPVKITKG